ncbi:hypothetical protein [Rhizobium sp. PEPV16]|uniref:hypothetical protein n=1 Tax=Rhizobium sp. PEPV16 TaxID=1820614 RepID=UPI00124CF5F1|nr:hypothetical protein [Rhizobium sp. PEPV16]KAF5888040.1 hypothetical protein FY112_01090 [Rhizobium sp. PEPV16]
MNHDGNDHGRGREAKITAEAFKIACAFLLSGSLLAGPRMLSTRGSRRPGLGAASHIKAADIENGVCNGFASDF